MSAKDVIFGGEARARMVEAHASLWMPKEATK